MCSTCNFKNYTLIENGILGQQLGMGNNLEIRCNLIGRDYKLCSINDVDGVSKVTSTFVIYRCPTCGRKLY